MKKNNKNLDNIREIDMRNIWTNEEIELIYNNYQHMTDEELMMIIPRHSVSSITTKRKRLGLVRSNRKYTYEDVVNTCNECDYILLSTEFTSCANKIDFICKKHEKYGVQHITYGHMLEGKGCYWCGREKSENGRRNLVTIEQRIDICQENGLKYAGSNYKDKLLNIEFYCLRHPEIGIQTMRYQNMKRGICGCRYCEKERSIIKSKGEVETAESLDKLCIRFVEQKVFAECKDINMLPFDFYLLDHNILIEFDGEQHYYPVTFNGISQQDAELKFATTKKHDDIKNNFCVKNNIPLIRIPYTKRGNILPYLEDKLNLLLNKVC